MASHVKYQDVGVCLSCPSKRENGAVRRRGRRPEGRWPYLWPIRACAVTPPTCCHAPGRRWGVALSACWGAVKAVGLGRAGGVGAPPDAA
ncbi:MAG: hypothetical protein ACJ788_18620 [Ktedonobacteraceae bacterium]